MAKYDIFLVELKLETQVKDIELLKIGLLTKGMQVSETARKANALRGKQSRWLCHSSMAALQPSALSFS